MKLVYDKAYTLPKPTSIVMRFAGHAPIGAELDASAAVTGICI